MNNQDQAAQTIYHLVKNHLGIEKELSKVAATRIAGTLNQAGLLASDLPKPNDPSIFVPDGKGWIPGGTHGPSVWTAPDSPIMVQRIEPGELTPDETRGVAYSMLAAANYSEGSNA